MGFVFLIFVNFIDYFFYIVVLVSNSVEGVSSERIKGIFSSVGSVDVIM